MSEISQTTTLQTILEYYSQPGAMSDPRMYAPRFEELPTTVPQLVKTLQGLLIHIFWAERYGLKLSEEREGEVQIRPVHRKLARMLELDARPLNEERPLERRLVSNCRDFSLLGSAMLRYRGFPARARCGFGTYFIPGHYEDHWMIEYWHAGEGRWVSVDAQLDALQQDALKIQFDPLDMPPGAFVTGGAAWLLCRRQQANPDDFGIFQWHGWDFIKGNLFRDLLALNKFEVLPWDMWSALEPPYAELTPAQLEHLDYVAELTLQGNAAFSTVRALYEQTPHYQAPAEWAE